MCMTRKINKKNIFITISITAIGICIGVYDRLANNVMPIESVLYWFSSIINSQDAIHPVESSQEIIMQSSTLSGFAFLSILIIAVVGIIIISSTMCYSARM